MLTVPLATPVISSVDLIILGIYLLFTAAWGSWRKQPIQDEESYLLGNRSIAWPALTLSIVATETSTVTFLSLPGQTFAEGGNMTFLQLTMGYIVGRFLVAWLLLPHYFEGKIFSAYELFEKRFGQTMRRSASVVFLTCRTMADGLRLLLTALALKQVLGWDYPTCVIVIAITTAIYATFGGVRSVVKNDCLQLIIYTLGALLAMWVIIRTVPGGLEQIVDFGKQSGRFHLIDFGTGFTDKYVNFWAGLIGGSILSLATHGVDQLMVQRYLSAESKQKASLALCCSGPLVALQFALFLFIGIALACFYAMPEQATIGRPDEAFATFLANEMPVGLCGLLLASVMAAAMSTLSSSVNSSAGVLIKDLVEPIFGKPEEAQTMRRLRYATVLFTALQAAVALIAYQVGLESSVITAVLAIAGFAFGILLGLMTLGLLLKKSNSTIGLAALIAGFIAGCAAKFYTEISWPWLGSISASAAIIVGLIFSMLVPKGKQTDDDA